MDIELFGTVTDRKLILSFEAPVPLIREAARHARKMDESWPGGSSVFDCRVDGVHYFIIVHAGDPGRAIVRRGDDEIADLTREDLIGIADRMEVGA